MKTTADVVIIGAGAIGCSTAYHLARMGIRDVAVVEMDQVGSGASGKSASMLSLQFGHDDLIVQMAQYSYRRYMAFEDEIGVPIDFRPIGWLSLATAESADYLLESARHLQSRGITTEIWSPEEIRRRYPEINTQDIVLGTWGPDDGPFDPHMILWGYSKRARQMGVALAQGVRATHILTDNGQVAGVVTDHGRIASRTVINAGGPWAVEIGRWAGVDLPIVNSARSIVVTGSFPPIPADRPFVYDLSVEWYFRPEGPGVLMGMGARPTTEPELAFSPEAMDDIIEAATWRVPLLEQAPFLTGWTGVRPMTIDDRPILGPAPGVDGLLLNCGWGGSGIIQAPIAGQLIAEYVASGRTSTLDIAPFSIERFAGRPNVRPQDLRKVARREFTH
ncbi:MAG: NAD(P)/FAD-dependent oxidoreductase [Chloroflexota bacterium]